MGGLSAHKVTTISGDVYFVNYYMAIGGRGVKGNDWSAIFLPLSLLGSYLL